MASIDRLFAIEHNDSEVLNYRGRDVGEEGLQAEHPNETPLKRGPSDAGHHHPEFLGSAPRVYDPCHLCFLRCPGQGQELLACWRLAIGITQHSLVCQRAEPMDPKGGI